VPKPLPSSSARIGLAVSVPRIARYNTLRPASEAASRAAKAASGKRDTKPEMILRKALWAAGLRGYRVDVRDLPGRPDVVFARARVAVFCDGDFWHGHDLKRRIAKLEAGHNAPYWVAKIEGNVARDRRHDAVLTAAGWQVLRFWEAEIKRSVDSVVGPIRDAITIQRNFLGPR